jgi:hypothetical protein
MYAQEPKMFLPASPEVQEPKTEESVQCCVFLDNYPRNECIGCSNGHWVHKKALEPYLNVELEKPIEYHQTRKGMKCPGCTETLRGERLLELLSPEMREKYLLLQERCAEKEKHEEEVAAKKPDDLAVLQESIRLQFTNGNGSFKGKMCPTCGFGPIEHFACENLRDHHHQRIAEGVHINNSCPLCTSFFKHIKTWKNWDGTFLSQERVDTVNKVKEVHVQEFDKYCKDLDAKYKQYESDSELMKEKLKQDLAKYKIDMDNYRNYYSNHGVQAPDVLARQMVGKKGQEKVVLAREYRKALRLWNRMPEEPKAPANNVQSWLREKRAKQKKLISEKETAMFKSIQADLKRWDKIQATLDSVPVQA